MTNPEFERWQGRYAAAPGHLFGEEPNHFLAGCADLLPQSAQVLAVAAVEGGDPVAVFVVVVGADAAAWGVGHGCSIGRGAARSGVQSTGGTGLGRSVIQPREAPVSGSMGCIAANRAGRGTQWGGYLKRATSMIRAMSAAAA